MLKRASLAGRPLWFALPAVVALAAFLYAFPSYGVWLLLGLLRHAALLGGFAIAAGAVLVALILARVRLQTILEGSRQWEARRAACLGPAAAASPSGSTRGGTVFLHSSFVVTEAKVPPGQVLFSKWKLPFPIAKELGEIAAHGFCV